MAIIELEYCNINFRNSIVVIDIRPKGNFSSELKLKTLDESRNIVKVI